MGPEAEVALQAEGEGGVNRAGREEGIRRA